MYSLEEISILPAVFSSIKSRKYISTTRNYFLNEFDSEQAKILEKLPVFVAPMTCLVNFDNFKVFEDSKVTPILPVYKVGDEEIFKKRLEYLENGRWTALTLKEFEEVFCRDKWNFDKMRVPYVCIDTANGHLKDIYTTLEYGKQHFPALNIMVGNIANPDTYYEICKQYLGLVKYIRVGIGGGSGCTTSVQTGVHASLPYLINDIQEIKERLKKTSDSSVFLPEIIADGGVNTTDRAIKCLALGADYVMMGSMFAGCKETSNYKEGVNLYYGQSSEQGQIDRFGKVKSNPEGLAKTVFINTTLKEVCEKIDAALRSAMSYCDADNLYDFIGKPKIKIQSIAECQSYYK